MSVYPYLSILTGYIHVLPTNYPGCLAGCHLAWSPRNKGTCPANQQKTTRRQTRWPRRQSPRRSCSCRKADVGGVQVDLAGSLRRAHQALGSDAGGICTSTDGGWGGNGGVAHSSPAEARCFRTPSCDSGGVPGPHDGNLKLLGKAGQQCCRSPGAAGRAPGPLHPSKIHGARALFGNCTCCKIIFWMLIRAAKSAPNGMSFCVYCFSYWFLRGTVCRSAQIVFLLREPL
jgi:hypothetical protein